MDEESVTTNCNMINLSLDDIVALNNRRQMQAATELAASEEAATSEVVASNLYTMSLDDIIRSKNIRAMKSKVTNYKKEIDNQLKNIPGFGSRPIHRRLGYSLNKNCIKRQKFYQSNHKYAVTLAKRSKQFLGGRKNYNLKEFFNPQVTIQNPNAVAVANSRFVSPLTTNSVWKFDRMNNDRNGFVKNGLGSTMNLSTTGSHRSARSFNKQITPFRHSIRNCLTPAIQLDIMDVSSKLEKRMLPSELDYSFSSYVHVTATTLDKRFSGYF